MWSQNIVLSVSSYPSLQVWWRSCSRFYRATRMHSADYAVARCLSVCLSVTRRYSVNTAEYILIFFTIRWPVPHHSVFPNSHTKHYGNIPMGTPLTGASNARGYEKIAILDEYLYLRMMQVKSHSYFGRRIWNGIPKLSNVAISNDLEWPLT